MQEQLSTLHTEEKELNPVIKAGEIDLHSIVVGSSVYEQLLQVVGQKPLDFAIEQFASESVHLETIANQIRHMLVEKENWISRIQNYEAALKKIDQDRAALRERLHTYYLTSRTSPTIEPEEIELLNSLRELGPLEIDRIARLAMAERAEGELSKDIAVMQQAERQCQDDTEWARNTLRSFAERLSDPLRPKRITAPLAVAALKNPLINTAVPAQPVSSPATVSTPLNYDEPLYDVEPVSVPESGLTGIAGFYQRVGQEIPPIQQNAPARNKRILPFKSRNK